MYPTPPASSAVNNSFQFQLQTTMTTANVYANWEDNTNYGAAGGGVTPWSTVAQPPPPPSGLIQQSSFPAALYHQHLISELAGISHIKEDGRESYNNYPQSQASRHKNKQSRYSSDQLTFIKHNDSNVNDAHYRFSSLKKLSTNSTPSNSHHLTVGPSEESNNNNHNSIRSDATYDSQVHNLEMGSTNNAKDMVAWRIRAKRGFATDPKSIAERERRTKINRKLKKLQELLPDVDKQASYAEMLDVAVEHVIGLQTQIQELNEGLNSCRCGCINHNY